MTEQGKDSTKFQRDNTRFILDTCFLMLAQELGFLASRFVPWVSQQKVTCILGTAIYHEIRKLQDRDDSSTSSTAVNVGRSLRTLQGLGLLDIVGEPEDTFGDAQLRTLCTHLQQTYDLVVFTQDVGLTHDLLLLNSSKSIERDLHKITVKALERDGSKLRDACLSEAQGTLARREALKTANNGSPSIKKRTRYTPPKVRYRPTLQLRPRMQIAGNEERPTISIGSPVSVERFGAFVLTTEIAKGGEGRIFEGPDEDHVLKIYHSSKLSPEREHKIELMIATGLDWAHPLSSSFAWPVAKVVDLDGRFVGYAMKRAEGEILASTIFIGRRLRNRFPGWDRTHLIKLCLAIVTRIRFLHDSNAIIGDINPHNIIVRDADDVTFIDTDSYQIDGYACPVGTPRFTAPELLDEKYGTHVLTRDHEIFSVATLLFMILHAGKPPYAQTDGSTPLDNLRSGKFPYRFDGIGGDNVPDGPWKYIWSNLTFKIQEAFVETFDQQFRGTLRIELQQWQHLLENYLIHLESDIDIGDQKRAMFPAGYKVVDGYCKQKECVECGAEFSISEKQIAYFKEKGLHEPVRCRDCRARRKELTAAADAKRESELAARQCVVETRVCKGCRQAFPITAGDMAYFQSKGHTLPLRCRPCRGLPK